MNLTPPALLEKSHDVSRFDCGKAGLNQFLQRFALGNQSGGASRTYVVVDQDSDDTVVGYYSVAPAAVTPLDVPPRVRKGQSQHPVPCILLDRLAVDSSAQGVGLGRSMLRDAFLRALRAHEQIGGRAFLVHAMVEDAMRFYQQYDMMPLATHPLNLFLLFKDLRALIVRE